ASVADLVDAEPATLGRDQRAEVATTLADAIGRLEALLARSAGAVSDHNDFVFDGARSPATWLAARSELSRRHVGILLRMDRELREFSHLRDAWSSGRLGTATIRMLL